jgi:hypothetical protein
MKSAIWLYIGAAVLFIMSICGVVWGGLMLLGSTASTGQSQWAISGGGLMLVGLAMIAGSIYLVVTAINKTKQETAQNIAMKLYLPGETKIEEMKCRSCGGTLNADSIKLVNGAPVVTCPFCNSIYQLTEEPKW